ncbi:unnamed protein product, partial [Amoebophrya sp. A25]
RDVTTTETSDHVVGYLSQLASCLRGAGIQDGAVAFGYFPGSAIGASFHKAKLSQLAQKTAQLASTALREKLNLKDHVSTSGALKHREDDALDVSLVAETSSSTDVANRIRSLATVDERLGKHMCHLIFGKMSRSLLAQPLQWGFQPVTSDFVSSVTSGRGTTIPSSLPIEGGQLQGVDSDQSSMSTLPDVDIDAESKKLPQNAATWQDDWEFGGGHGAGFQLHCANSR